MTTSEGPERLPLSLSRDFRALGRGRRPADDTSHRRVRRGAYVESAAWFEAGDRSRHLARVRAVAETRRIEAVFSHRSAAALHGLPTLHPLPVEVDAITPPASRRRRGTGVLWHHLELDPSDIVTVDGLLVTSLPRTLLDIARTASFAEAVVQLDAGLAMEQPSFVPERWDWAGARVERGELDRRVDELGTAAGSRRAACALDFADARSGSVGESLSRIQMHAWGVPQPQLQVAVVGESGRRYVADFAWNDGRLLGEFDGRVKYSRAAALSAAPSEEIVWAEKRREDDIRARHHDVVRWSWSDAVDGLPLVAKLERRGLIPTRRQPLPILTRGTT
jgi:hypothetical protein